MCAFLFLNKLQYWNNQAKCLGCCLDESWFFFLYTPHLETHVLGLLQKHTQTDLPIASSAAVLLESVSRWDSWWYHQFCPSEPGIGIAQVPAQV